MTQLIKKVLICEAMPGVDINRCKMEAVALVIEHKTEVEFRFNKTTYSISVTDLSEAFHESRSENSS